MFGNEILIKKQKLDNLIILNEKENNAELGG